MNILTFDCYNTLVDTLSTDTVLETTAQLAPEVLAAWKAWAAEQTTALQRASSVVEGRNGSLSQRHHNHRDLPKRRARVRRCSRVPDTTAGQRAGACPQRARRPGHPVYAT